MILLSRVLAHDDAETICSAHVEDDMIFVSSAGRVAAWFAVEYMAQAIAVHAGLSLRRRGQRPRTGLLLGCRRVRIHAPFLHTGQHLEARARRVWGGAQGWVAFDCGLRDVRENCPLAEGRLNCFLVDPAVPLEQEQ